MGILGLVRFLVLVEAFVCLFVCLFYCGFVIAGSTRSIDNDRSTVLDNAVNLGGVQRSDVDKHSRQTVKIKQR